METRKLLLLSMPILLMFIVGNMLLSSLEHAFQQKQAEQITLLKLDEGSK